MTLFTVREAWTLIHGILFGGGFLLAFTGGLALLYNLKADLLTTAGARRHVRWLKLATLVMAGLTWLAVLSGTYISYPWYRATPPEGVTDLTSYPVPISRPTQVWRSGTPSAWSGKSTSPGSRRCLPRRWPLWCGATESTWPATTDCAGH